LHRKVGIRLPNYAT